MVADVKEKLDIWRYSRTCSKAFIIFFLYNLLSLLYHATILCCVDIYSVDRDNFSILCSAKARQLSLSLSEYIRSIEILPETCRHLISAGFPLLFFFPRVAECHSWSSMFDQRLVFGERFDSRPGLPCCNCLRVSQENLTAGSQDFEKAGHLKFPLESYRGEPKHP